MINLNEKNLIFNEKLPALLNHDELEIVRSDYNTLLDFGFEYIELDDYTRAFDLFMINLKINGYSADALNGIAISLLELNNPHAAQQTLEKAVELYPDDSITLANIAGIYWELNNYEKAIYFYNKSLKINEEIIDTHFNLINLHYENNNLFMAYLCSLNLIEVFPKDKQARQLANEILIDIAIANY